MSYEPMVRAESELAGEVEAMLADAQRIDDTEDAAYGAQRRGDELPSELTRREGRLAAIRTAKAALEAEHAATARAGAEPAEAGAVVPGRAQRLLHRTRTRGSLGSFLFASPAPRVVWVPVHE